MSYQWLMKGQFILPWVLEMYIVSSRYQYKTVQRCKLLEDRLNQMRDAFARSENERNRQLEARIRYESNFLRFFTFRLGLSVNVSQKNMKNPLQPNQFQNCGSHFRVRLQVIATKSSSVVAIILLNQI